MSLYKTRILARDEVANGTMAFHLEKPAGFEFKPGQAMDVILPGAAAPDSPDARHAFSIVTAPHENELMFATRMRDSAFKRALRALPIGAELEIDGPFGSLTLHKNVGRAGVLIAGGIGITPFMSMLRHAAANPSTQPLTLLYSNRRPEDTAFLAELQGYAAKNPSFRLVATMTNMDQSAKPWDGPTQMIDAAFVQRAVEGLPSPIFYMSGPPGMVEAMAKTLVAADVDDDDVRSETFYGY